MGSVIFDAATRLRQVSDATWGYVDPFQDGVDDFGDRIEAYKYFQGRSYFVNTLRPLPPVFTKIMAFLGSSLKAMDVIGFTAITIELTCPKDGKFVLTDPDNSWQKKVAKVTKFAAKAIKAVDAVSYFGYIDLRTFELGTFVLTKVGGTTYFKLTKDFCTLGSLVFTIWDHNLPQSYERCVNDKQRYEHRLKNLRLVTSVVVVSLKILLDLNEFAPGPMFAYATVFKVVVNVGDYSYGFYMGYYSLYNPER